MRVQEYLVKSLPFFNVQVVGDRCVPELPAAEREVYIRHVSSTEGLAALAAAVVRNASSMLREVSNGKPGPVH